MTISIGDRMIFRAARPTPPEPAEVPVTLGALTFPAFEAPDVAVTVRGPVGVTPAAVTFPAVEAPDVAVVVSDVPLSQQTIRLATDVFSAFPSLVFWSYPVGQRIAIDQVFNPSGVTTTRYFQYLSIQLADGRLVIRFSDPEGESGSLGGDDLSSAFEPDGIFTLSAPGVSSVDFGLLGADTEEQYQWVPSNGAAVAAFATAYNALAVKPEASLIIRDGSLPASAVMLAAVTFPAFEPVAAAVSVLGPVAVQVSAVTFPAPSFDAVTVSKGSGSVSAELSAVTFPAPSFDAVAVSKGSGSVAA